MFNLLFIFFEIFRQRYGFYAVKNFRTSKKNFSFKNADLIKSINDDDFKSNLEKCFDIVCVNKAYCLKNDETNGYAIVL